MRQQRAEMKQALRAEDVRIEELLKTIGALSARQRQELAQALSGRNATER